MSFFTRHANQLTARGQWAIVTLTIGAFFAITASAAYRQSMTIDENRHIRYGANLLQGNARRFDDSKMPVTALNAAVRAGLSQLPKPTVARLNILFAERLVTILFSALIALVVFLWSRSLYGFVPGLAALACYVFDPNIIAHSQFVTTDLYAAGTIALACFQLWRFAHHRTVAQGMLAAFFLGLSQIAKYTSVVLFPIFFVVILLFDLYESRATWEATDLWPAFRSVFVRCCVYLAVATAISLLVINAAFLFDRTFTPCGDYRFRSRLLGGLVGGHQGLRSLPVPVPYPYLEGLDWVIAREATHVGFGSLYLLGQLSQKPFPGYYFIATLLKVPIAIQMVVVGAIGAYVIDARRRRRFFTDEIFLAAPALFFALYFNFFYNAEIGIRHYLVIFPLVYVFAGSLFSGAADFSRNQWAGAMMLLVWLVSSTMSYYPHFLPYFNEIVWDRTQGYKYLADSNLDWGQAGYELASYLKEHRDAYYISPREGGEIRPRQGLLVVNPNKLVGVNSDPAQLRWLRENFEPSDTIAYAFLVYEISESQIVELCRSTDYCQK